MMRNRRMESCQSKLTDLQSSTNDVDVSLSDWSLEEDLMLLSAIVKCETDDWVQISQLLRNRTPVECRNHYVYYFLQFPATAELDYVKSISNNGRKHYKSKLKQEANEVNQLMNNFGAGSECAEDNKIHNSKTDNCLKPTDLLVWHRLLAELEVCTTDKNSVEVEQPLHLCVKLDVTEPAQMLYNSLMAGYNPFRSDFDSEYDNCAEDVLSLLNYDFQNSYDSCSKHESVSSSKCDNDDILIKELTVKIIEGYNLRLKERKKKKEIVRNYGLINPRKVIAYQSRIEAILGKENYKSVIHCMQLVSAFEFDKLMESLRHSFLLRGELYKLFSYRKEGLRTNHSIKTYEKLKKLRDISFDSTRKKNSFSLLSPFEVPARRKAAPLIIHHLPGFKHLNESEITLCSSNRILPNLYLKFKSQLITECEKNGGLKLSQARSLLKIDVNKTRKIYDYLIDAGSIWMS